jgi:hypothetical protein
MKNTTAQNAINSFRNAFEIYAEALKSNADRATKAKASKAKNVAARNLWNVWNAEGHPESIREILNAYNICFA